MLNVNYILICTLIYFFNMQYIKGLSKKIINFLILFAPLTYSLHYLPPIFLGLQIVFLVGVYYYLYINKHEELMLGTVILPWMINLIILNSSPVTIIFALMCIKVITMLIKSNEVFNNEKYFKYATFSIKNTCTVGILSIIFYSLSMYVLKYESFTYDFTEAYHSLSTLFIFVVMGGLASQAELSVDDLSLNKSKALLIKFINNLLIPTVVTYKIFDIMNINVSETFSSSLIILVILMIMLAKLFSCNSKAYITSGISQINSIDIATLLALYCLDTSVSIELIVLAYSIVFLTSNFFKYSIKKNKYLLSIVMGAPYSPVFLFKLYLLTGLSPKLSFLTSLAFLVIICGPLVLIPRYIKETCENN